ncbi:Hsp20 family protein [Candidatus Hepatincolaceae symbiont of Richtersius coronifer]
MSKLFLRHNYMLGFDYMEEMLEKISKSENYPPYDIEQEGEEKIVIKIAVAGFKEKDLSIIQENNQLIVSGQHSEELSSNKCFLHKGICSRKFQKTFVLAEGVEPVKSYINNGLLVVELKKEKPLKSTKVISIEKHP